MRIKEFYEKQNDVFLNHYLIAAGTGDEEAIHQMRVALKKIFALCSFLRSCKLVDKPQLGYLKKARKLFRLAGNLRDNQIQLQILKEYEPQFSLPDYESQITNQIEEGINCWTKKACSFSLTEYVKFKVILSHIINQIPDEHVRTSAKDFILNQIHFIEDLLLHENWKEKLHKVRIHLKQMHRIFQLYRPTPILIPTEQIKKVELQLGRWHDHLIVLENIEQFSATNSKNYSLAKNIISSELQHLASPLRKQLLLEFTYIKEDIILPPLSEM
ncbi:MAG: CHAD domain-containing protein [Marinifilaceae bacterium]